MHTFPKKINSICEIFLIITLIVAERKYGGRIIMGNSTLGMSM